MIRGIIVLLLLTLSVGTAYGEVDHYKYNPYTSNLDNIGSLNITDDPSTCLAEEHCFVYTPTTLSLWMLGNQVHDWIIVQADQFLLLLVLE